MQTLKKTETMEISPTDPLRKMDKMDFNSHRKVGEILMRLVSTWEMSFAAF